LDHECLLRVGDGRLGHGEAPSFRETLLPERRDRSAYGRVRAGVDPAEAHPAVQERHLELGRAPGIDDAPDRRSR
jgi:hypothetical protein